VGRGTETPFEIIGAPWIDGPQLGQALNQAGLPGVQFRAVTFTPTASKFKDQQCQGVTITITDRNLFKPIRTGLEIARTLRTLYPEDWNTQAYDRLLGNKQVLDAVLAAKPVAEIESIYRAGLEEFLERRSRFLLYQP